MKKKLTFEEAKELLLSSGYYEWLNSKEVNSFGTAMIISLAEEFLNRKVLKYEISSN